MLVRSIVNVESRTILLHVYVHQDLLEMLLNLVSESLKTYQKILVTHRPAEEMLYAITEIVTVTMIILVIHTCNVDPSVL